MVGSQYFPRLIPVFANLFRQSIQTIKFLLGSNILDHGDAKLKAIQITFKIKEMHLQQFLFTIPDRGSFSQIGNPAPPLQLLVSTLLAVFSVRQDRNANSINAKSRANIFIQSQISRRETYLPPSLVAMLDTGVDFPPMT